MKLIYVMDPQCGWCYGNSDNITLLQEEFGEKFEFELLVGGMWRGQKAPRGSDNLRAFMEQNVPRMASTTGVEVGKEFFDIASDSSYIFSSLEPSAAIVVVKSIASDKAFAFAKKVQQLLMLEGKRLDRLENYLPILVELEIDKEEFEKQWMTGENLENTKAEFSRAGTLVNGFPTLLLKKEENYELLSSCYFDINAMKGTLQNI